MNQTSEIKQLVRLAGNLSHPAIVWVFNLNIRLQLAPRRPRAQSKYGVYSGMIALICSLMGLELTV